MINEISNGTVMVSGWRPQSPIMRNARVIIEVGMDVKRRPAACA